MTRHDTDAPWDRVAQPGQHIHRESTRPAVKEDLLVPGCWVAYGAAIVGLLALIGTLLVRDAWELQTKECFAIAVGVGMAAWALLYWHFTRLLWDGLNFISTVEDITGLDINRDGAIGPPPVTITVQNPDSQHLRRIPDICTEDQLRRFIHGVLIEKRTLAVAQWVGRGRPFSRTEYDAFMAQCHRADIVRWKDPAEPNQGRELTAYGRNLLTQAAGQLGMQGGRDMLMHAYTQEDST